jgi:hypothetical protein
MGDPDFYYLWCKREQNLAVAVRSLGEEKLSGYRDERRYQTLFLGGFSPDQRVEGSCFLELRETPLENQASKFVSLSVFVLRRFLDL